jgi:hypothetical protein
MCGALAVAGLALTGCVTPPAYGPIGPESRYGYRDTRNADGSYTVRVVTNNAGLAHTFWDRRAQELCGGPDFDKNIFRAEIPVVTYSGTATGPSGYTGYYTADQYGDLILEGYLRCKSDATAPAPAPEGAPPQAAPPPQETPRGNTP